jgi:bla regulator protein BlaR1
VITADVVFSAAEALGGLLVVQSALVLGTGVVVLLLDRIMRRCGPGLRLTLWTLVFVRMLLPTDFGAGWSLANLVHTAMPGGVVAAPSWSLERADTRAEACDTSAPVPAPARAAVSWQGWLAGVWLAGAGWSLWRVAHRRRRALAVVRRAAPVDDAWADRLTAPWRDRWNLRRQISLLVSDEAVGPFTLGTRRPVVVLPAVVAERRSVAEVAVAHEIAHVARLDDLQLLVQQVLQAVFFFHPMVWLAGRRVETERELCTDARVLATTVIGPRHYALGLLDAAGLGLRAGPQPSLFDHTRRVAMRIERIVSFSHPSRPSTSWSVVALIAAAALALPLAASSDDPAPEVPAPPTVAPPAPHALPVPENPPSAPAPPASARPAVNAPRLAEPLPDGRLTMGWGTTDIRPAERCSITAELILPRPPGRRSWLPPTDSSRRFWWISMMRPPGAMS